MTITPIQVSSKNCDIFIDKEKKIDALIFSIWEKMEPLIEQSLQIADAPCNFYPLQKEAKSTQIFSKISHLFFTAHLALEGKNFLNQTFSKIAPWQQLDKVKERLNLDSLFKNAIEDVRNSYERYAQKDTKIEDLLQLLGTSIDKKVTANISCFILKEKNIEKITQIYNSLFSYEEELLGYSGPIEGYSAQSYLKEYLTHITKSKDPLELEREFISLGGDYQYLENHAEKSLRNLTGEDTPDTKKIDQAKGFLLHKNLTNHLQKIIERYYLPEAQDRLQVVLSNFNSETKNWLLKTLFSTSRPSWPDQPSLPIKPIYENIKKEISAAKEIIQQIAANAKRNPSDEKKLHDFFEKLTATSELSSDQPSLELCQKALEKANDLLSRANRLFSSTIPLLYKKSTHEKLKKELEHYQKNVTGLLAPLRACIDVTHSLTVETENLLQKPLKLLNSLQPPPSNYNRKARSQAIDYVKKLQKKGWKIVTSGKKGSITLTLSKGSDKHIITSFGNNKATIAALEKLIKQ